MEKVVKAEEVPEMEKVIQVLISLTKGNVIIRMAIGIWH